MKITTHSTSGLSRRQFLERGMMLAAAPWAAESIGFKMDLPAWQQASEKKIRIGVVGGRFGLAFHWNEHPNCIVEAVSDLIPDRREQLMGKYECEKSYESLEKLILDPAIDAVAVFTPAPDHAHHVTLCMEHGKHVISACPSVMTLEEAAQVKEVKERTGMRYMQAETSYYRWETILARQLYEVGVFGEMVYCEGEYYHPGIGRADNELSTFNGERTWRWAFPPMLYPTHSTAFLIGVTGERLTSVSCIGTGDPDEPSLKDNRYNNPFLNGMAMFETDKGHPFRCNVAWDIHADGERAQWFGDKASMFMPGYGGQPFALKLPQETITEMPDYWHLVPEKMRYDSGHGRSHSFITNEFITALIEDREPSTNLYTALAFCVPGIMAHESALKGGERLKIPQFDPAPAA